jgi:RimJ/RimL family protein N-acetyltransferase
VDAAAIARRCAEVDLPDGGHLVIRPIRATDRALVAEAFLRLSPRTRYRRFFAPLTVLAEPFLTALTEVDYVDRFAWVALACEDDGSGGRKEALVGVARYARLDDPVAAECALVVVDAFQGRGIGSLLLDALILEAIEAGITRFEGEVLADNGAMRGVLRENGARFRVGDERGASHFAFDLPSRADAMRSHPMYDVLRRLAQGDVSLYEAEPCPWGVA